MMKRNATHARDVIQHDVPSGGGHLSLGGCSGVSGGEVGHRTIRVEGQHVAHLTHNRQQQSALRIILPTDSHPRVSSIFPPPGYTFGARAGFCTEMAVSAETNVHHMRHVTTSVYDPTRGVLALLADKTKCTCLDGGKDCARGLGRGE